MRLQGSFKRAACLLREAESFLIVPHLHPDGDALGSALGLYHALKQMGKTHVVAVSHDPCLKSTDTCPTGSRFA
jgi:bifunctional oligoribonuclease and PAP phosphatase NrnA